jgi:putative oxidoreductase
MLRRLARTTPLSADLGLLLLRGWFGLVLAFGHGLSKVGDLGGFSAKVGSIGVPAASLLAPAAALSEFVGGILLAIGLLSRVAAAFVLATMLTAAFFVHARDPFSKQEFALAYAVAALCVLVAGPGRLSLDHRLFGQAPRSSAG